MKSEKGSKMEQNKVSATRALVAGFAALSMLTLAACGGTKTNPVEDYSELKDSVPPTDNKPRNQAVLDPSSFRIDTDRYLYFTEGKDQAYFVKPPVKLAGLPVAMTIDGLPKEISFEPAKDAEHAGQYVLAWSPKVGTLSEDESYRPYKFTIGLKLTGQVRPEVAQFVKEMGHPRDFELRLLPSEEIPVIEKAEIDSSSVQEGQMKSFTVVVKDPASTPGHPPVLFPVSEKGLGTEVVRVNGAPYVSLDSDAVSLGESRWKFTVVFDARRIELPKTDKQVYARFLLRAVGRRKAPDQVVELLVVPAGKEAANPTEAQKPVEPQAKADDQAAPQPKVTAPIPQRKPAPPQSEPSTGGSK